MRQRSRKREAKREAAAHDVDNSAAAFSSSLTRGHALPPLPAPPPAAFAASFAASAAASAAARPPPPAATAAARAAASAESRPAAAKGWGAGVLSWGNSTSALQLTPPAAPPSVGRHASTAKPTATGYALGGRLGGGGLAAPPLPAAAAAAPLERALDIVPIDLAHADWLERLWDLPDPAAVLGPAAGSPAPAAAAPVAAAPRLPGAILPHHNGGGRAVAAPPAPPPLPLPLLPPQPGASSPWA